MLHPSIKRVELEGDAGRPEIGVRNDRRNLAGKMEHRASVDRSGDAVGRDVSGDILRPSFSGIEAYDADGIFILPFEEIAGTVSRSVAPASASG
jgi:hypothetical protein